MAGLNFPYRLFGGALRPDAISGLTQPMRDALTKLYATAPTSVQKELGLTSAYRSRAVQQQLWDASDKTGRTVAAPGHSKHNFGTAADLWGFGLGGHRQVSPETYDWVHQHAGEEGLYFPMSYEPWHIQMRSGVGSSPGVGDTGQDTAAYADTSKFHVGGASVGGSGSGYFRDNPQPTQPGSIYPDLGPPLSGDDKKQSLGGLMGKMLEKPPIQTPNMPPMQGPGGPSLAEIIQKYLQTTMVGGPPNTGGQGLG